MKKSPKFNPLIKALSLDVAWDKFYLKEEKRKTEPQPSHKMPTLWDFFYKSKKSKIVHTINPTAKVALMKN